MLVLIRLVRGDTSTLERLHPVNVCMFHFSLVEKFSLSELANRAGSSAYRRTSGWTGAVLPPLCSVIMVSCCELASLWLDLGTHTQLCMMGSDGSVSHRGPSQVATAASSLAWQVTPPPCFFCFLHHSWRWSDKRPQRSRQARLDLHERLCRLWRLTAVLMWNCELCGWSMRRGRSDNLHQRPLRRIMATDQSFVCVRDIKHLRPVQQGHSGTTEDICTAGAAGCHFSIVIHILYFAICSQRAGSDDSLWPISVLQCFLSTSARLQPRRQWYQRVRVILVTGLVRWPVRRDFIEIIIFFTSYFLDLMMETPLLQSTGLAKSTK